MHFIALFYSFKKFSIDNASPYCLYESRYSHCPHLCPTYYHMHSKFYVSVCHYHCCYLGMEGKIGILQKNNGGPGKVVFLTKEIPHAKPSR